MLKMEAKLEGVEEFKKMVSADLFRKAMRSTLDKSGTQVKRLITDEITQEFNIKASDVRSKINVVRTTFQSLEMWIRIASTRLSLLYFGAVQTASGVSAFIRKGKVHSTPHGFIQTMRSGHRDAFARKGRKRLPIRTLGAPGVVELANTVLKKPGIDEKLQGVMEQIFSDEVVKRTGVKL